MMVQEHAIVQILVAWKSGAPVNMRKNLAECTHPVEVRPRQWQCTGKYGLWPLRRKRRAMLGIPSPLGSMSAVNSFLRAEKQVPMLA